MNPTSVLLVSIGDNIPLPALSIKGRISEAIRGQAVSDTYFGGEFGEPPYTFSVISGSEPPGTTLDTDGALVGTYTTQGFYEFEVETLDSLGNTDSAVFAIQVGGGIVVNTALPYCETGIPYSVNLLATGGTGPYTWALHAGTLPPGFTLVGDVLSGTRSSVSFPTLDTFTLRCTDSTGNYEDAVFKLAVWRPINLSDAAHVFCLLNTAFSKRYVPSWGIVAGSPLEKYALPKVTFSIDDGGGIGGLPSGLSLDPVQGIISGAPQAGGNFFNIVVTDEMGGTYSLFQEYHVQSTQLPYTLNFVFGNTVDTSYEFSIPYFENYVAQVYNRATGEVVEVVIRHDDSDWNNRLLYIETVKAPGTDAYNLVIVGT